MLKHTHKSSENENSLYKGYYPAIAKACGCSATYVRMVITNNLGSYKNKIYKNRENELTKKILAKKEELAKFLQPNNE
jgi:hypothetical protein